jgi:hypothetical protein
MALKERIRDLEAEKAKPEEVCHSPVDNVPTLMRIFL